VTFYQRRQSLLELLRRKPNFRVRELAESLKVSEGTVRNDLNALEASGRLIRVHGGAVLSEAKGFQSATFSTRYQDRSTEKMLIARQAARLVKDGDSILLDASSTTYYFALAVKDCQGLRVVTNGLDLARLLSQNPSNTVILIGGVLTPEGSSVTGLFSEQIIEELRIQKAFVSCSGFSLGRGMTEVHLAEAQLKRKAVESATQLIALIDSSKFGKEDLTPFARPDQITHLFTDAGLSQDWEERLGQAGIPFTICAAESSPDDGSKANFKE
jgi:DeoR/GlpR family transcriptional regulator of sugar metabolism